jgi:cytochrome c
MQNFFRAGCWAFCLFCLFSCSTTEKSKPVGQLAKAPEENRFTKTVLVEDLKEPMELAVADNGEVYWAERYGNVHRYDPTTGQAAQIGKVEVFSGNNDGLLGITLDPAFLTNQFLYLFYSPAGDVPRQHISRFTLKNGQMDPASEKVLLSIPTQRELCCHSGGSLAFGPNGDLYISAGDNTNPWEQEGYAPLDERPGKQFLDAQGTAANTQDLRGKILRIRPQADGSYTIPAGNLFSKDGKEGRPEIYVMGTRNPFRISIDQPTGYLYFSDIGPDANVSSEKGPMAHEEINLAREPGNYGWPYFVGDNKAYPMRDFATNVMGKPQDPAAPVNESPNNTGAQKLPPARKAMIWYGAEESEAFPEMGKGGRSAMAGPVYHYDSLLNSEGKFPAYYDKRLFIYDWMRDWVKVVTLDENGGYSSMAPFLPGTVFSSPMDMEFGKDGTLYILEYGEGWYSNNKDAKLSRITFNKGNRPPIAKADASVTAGKVPLTVQFTSDGTLDYDGDSLRYQWRFDSAATQATSTEPNPSFTFAEPGMYPCTLTVSDPSGEKSEARVEVIVGNTPPQIAVEIKGNGQFYWEKVPIPYEVKLTDPEDGSLQAGSIPSDAVKVFADYSTSNDNLSPLLTSHQSAVSHPGKVLIDGSDCKGCHLLNGPSIGPSYQEVAQKYRNDPHATDRLSNKIIKGGGGVWKKNFVMISHPQLTQKAATEMVRYILSLGEEGKQAKRVGVKGEVVPVLPTRQSNEGFYRISASYTDKGGEKVGPLTREAAIVLKSPRIQAESYHSANRMKVIGELEDGNGRYLGNIQNNSNALFKAIDLTDIASVTSRMATATSGVSLEFRLDSSKGELLGTVELTPTGSLSEWKEVAVPLKATTGVHDLHLTVKCKNGSEKNVLNLDWLFFNRKAAM